jgi:hypothetical protein
LDAVVMRALAADRSQRFSTAREMRLALESALPGTTQPCNERDLEALMIKLFGRRLADRRHALTSAAALVDAKGGLATPPRKSGPSQARSQSTMRAVMVSVNDADIVVGDDEIRSHAAAPSPQLVEPEGMPSSSDLASIRLSTGSEPSVEEQVQLSSSVMPPPMERTGSTWLPVPESKRSSRRRGVVALGASAALVLGLATVGLVTNRFGLTLGVHDSGFGVAAVTPMALAPAAPAPSALVAAEPNGDPSSAHHVEPGNVDATDAGVKMAAPSAPSAAPPTLVPPRSATPGSRDRRGVKSGGDSDKSRRTDRADPASADPANPPAWDPLRARK